MHVHIFTCIYSYMIYKLTGAGVSRGTPRDVYVYIHICTYIHTYTHTHKYTHIHIMNWAHANTCIYTYIHLYIFIFICMQVLGVMLCTKEVCRICKTYYILQPCDEQMCKICRIHCILQLCKKYVCKICKIYMYAGARISGGTPQVRVLQPNNSRYFSFFLVFVMGEQSYDSFFFWHT